jgi:ribosomal protein S18 acetylase RimI-like enzyme
VTVPHPLDQPVLSALLGPHAHLAERHGPLVRYPVAVSPFLAATVDPDGADPFWTRIAHLYGSGARVFLPAVPFDPPGWEVVATIDGVQLIDEKVDAVPDPDAVRLGPDDVPEMLDLVSRTEPGPFLARTIELGHYLGIRAGGALIAMAGERLRPTGFTEVSAVCTDPAYRGRGLGSRLIRAVVAGIRERGDVAFLHAAAHNESALRLYEALGFRLRRSVSFRAVRVP